MESHSEKAQLQSLLKRYGIHVRKSLGQHFLADEVVLDRIAEAVGADACCNVIEIGAGAGTLTSKLAATGAQITAIELDHRFERLHSQRLRYENVRFAYEDALDFDYSDAARQTHAAQRRLLIAGNIPYQITSPLILKILESGAAFDSMTLLMQREVAERLAAAPGSRRNGTITIKVQFFCHVEELFNVPARVFLPPPEVESSLVRFSPRRHALEPEQRRSFFRLVDAAFAQRRKMLANSVAAKGIGYSKTQVDAALAAIGISHEARAEQLGLEQFLELRDKLSMR